MALPLFFLSFFISDFPAILLFAECWNIHETYSGRSETALA